MPKITEYRCLLISPKDVSQERDALAALVNAWNAQIGRTLNVRVELVRSETHSSPDLQGPPQNVLNRQLVKDCHFGIALFWSRIGTPTSSYLSGSDEEIHRLLDSGVRVLVYFNRSPIPQENRESDQYARLCELRTDLQTKGLVGYYDDVTHLREQVQLHLTSVVSALLAQEAPGPNVEVLTAPRPDIRVSSAVAVVGNESVPMLSISIENHSPTPAFLKGVHIELKGDKNLFVERDAATGELNHERRLEPGDSFDFHICPAKLSTAVNLSMRRAVIKDKIGNMYYSDEAIFQKQLALLLSQDKGIAHDAKPDGEDYAAPAVGPIAVK